jgi:hypothetical protein
MDKNTTSGFHHLFLTSGSKTAACDFHFFAVKRKTNLRMMSGKAFSAFNIKVAKKQANNNSANNNKYSNISSSGCNFQGAVPNNILQVDG